MRLKEFFLVWMATFGFWTAVALQSTLYPLYMREAGYLEGMIGFITGSAALGGLLGRPVLGWAVDKFGTRRFMVIGGLIWMLSAPLVPYTQDAGLLLVYRLVQGFGGGMITAATLAFVTFVTPLEQRGQVISWWDTSGSASNLVGPVTAAWLATAFGFLPAFIGVGLAGTLTVIFALLLRDVRPGGKQSGEPVKFRMFVRSALLPGFFGMVVGYAAGGLIVLSPIIATDLGVRNAGLLMLAFSIGTLVVRPLMAPLSDRKGREWVILPGFILVVTSLIMMALAHSGGLAIGAMFVFGMGVGSLVPGLMALSVDGSAEHERGTAGNTFYALWEIGIFLGSLIGGALLQRLGNASFFGTAVLVLASMAGFVWFERQKRKKVIAADKVF